MLGGLAGADIYSFWDVHKGHFRKLGHLIVSQEGLPLWEKCPCPNSHPCKSLEQRKLVIGEKTRAKHESWRPQVAL